MSITVSPDDLDKLRAERRVFEQLGLSEYARHQRRAMLLVAAAVFAMSWGGVRPSEITAFGVRITRWEESFLLAFLGFVLAYLIGNFASTARPEFVTWKDEIDKYSARIAVSGASALQMISQGVTLLRSVIDDPAVADKFTPQIREGLPKVEEWLNTANVEKHRARYIEMYRARVRFEYTVPVIISFSVLYLAVARIWRLAT